MLLTKYLGSKSCVFLDKQDIFIFPNISLSKTCDPRAGPFLPQGHNLNKIGRGLLPNSKALGLVVSNEKIITCLA